MSEEKKVCCTEKLLKIFILGKKKKSISGMKKGPWQDISP